MRDQKFQDIKAKVLAACARAKEEGIKVKPGAWGFFKTGYECCPMTAVAGEEGNKGVASEIAARELGVREKDVWAFVHAFDDKNVFYATEDKDPSASAAMAAIGREVRAELGFPPEPPSPIEP